MRDGRGLDGLVVDETKGEGEEVRGVLLVDLLGGGRVKGERGSGFVGEVEDEGGWVDEGSGRGRAGRDSRGGDGVGDGDCWEDELIDACGIGRGRGG